MLTLLKLKKFQLGFTLIELLIAVVIIVILVTIGAVSYTTVNRNARDAQRKSDLKRIQIVLEEFKADRGSYPDEHGDAGPFGNSDYFTCSTRGDLAGDALVEIFEGNAFTCGTNTYLSRVPGDPRTGEAYLYEIYENIKWDSLSRTAWCDNPTDPADPPAKTHGNCKNYTLWARLENTNDPNTFNRATSTDELCNIAYDIESYIRPGPPDGKNLNYCVHN